MQLYYIEKYLLQQSYNEFDTIEEDIDNETLMNYFSVKYKNNFFQIYSLITSKIKN